MLEGAGHRPLVLFVALGSAVECLGKIRADAKTALRSDTTDSLQHILVDGESDVLLGHTLSLHVFYVLGYRFIPARTLRSRRPV